MESTNGYDDEMDRLYPAIDQGDLEACIRFAKFIDEKKIDELNEYRDVIKKMTLYDEGVETD